MKNHEELVAMRKVIRSINEGSSAMPVPRSRSNDDAALSKGGRKSIGTQIEVVSTRRPQSLAKIIPLELPFELKVPTNPQTIMRQILMAKRSKSTLNSDPVASSKIKKVSSTPLLSANSKERQKNLKSIPPINFDCANLSPFVRELTGRNSLKGHISRHYGSYRSL